MENNKNIFFFASKFCLPTDTINKNSISFHYLKNKKDFFKILSLVIELNKFIKKNKIESIFIFSTIPINSLISYIIPKNVSITYYLHDPIPHSGENTIFKTIKYYDDILLSQKVKKVLISSDYIKKDLLQTSFKNTDYSILPLPLVDSLVTYKNFDTFKKSIIFFGRIEKYKGLDWFFESLIKYGNFFKEKNVPIYIIGKGILPENIKQAIENGFNIVLDNNYVSNEKLATLINESKVAIFPYRDATGTSAIQTAGAMGLWPIVSDVGGLKESCINQFSSIVDSNDQKKFIEHMIEAYLNEISPTEISNAYRKKYSIDIFSQKLIDLIV
ncbi:glycosyltransferase [Acinetobacter cumulans]|uniref:glycosyltransferase n=1 Tax=Acinetobacter cumulans TaxID=2136182 RepID=UPI00148BB51E|nr:glycosyltransferase [Acinetobacter cumulans]